MASEGPHREFRKWCQDHGGEYEFNNSSYWGEDSDHQHEVCEFDNSIAMVENSQGQYRGDGQTAHVAVFGEDGYSLDSSENPEARIEDGALVTNEWRFKP